MGAPTWPPTPEEAKKLTLQEYGDAARAVMDGQTDEEAEQALLAQFLFAPPERQLVAGEDNGLVLDGYTRALSAWLRMLSGTEMGIGYSDPPTTDGDSIYLPRAVPSPLDVHEDQLLFRVMALIQLGFVRFGLLGLRGFLAEVHRDWVLRSTFHLLASRYIIARWAESWPGIAADFQAIRMVEKAARMRVGLTQVPRRGMPAPFLPLYAGLTDLVEQSQGDGGPAREAVDVIDAIADVRAAPAVIIGQSQKLRAHFLKERLGAPPLPYFVGILRPEWLLHDLRAELKARDEWKDGPKPLRQLLNAVKKDGGRSGRLRQALRKMRSGTDSPAPIDEAERQIEALEQGFPPGESQDGRQHDEWDDEKGVYRLAATHVIEEAAPPGPLENYRQIVQANQAEIAAVRRKFAALRIEERWVHGQQDGQALDVDRAVVAMIDVKAGHDPKRDWYMRYQRQREAVAILTLVDLSGSTQGHVIHLEQRALVLCAEGLSTLGYPHAFFGFSNQGAQKCLMQRLKGWDEGYDEPIYRRLGNLRPGGATRMGAFIRDATKRLALRPEGRRILMVLSDGRPHDKGEYAGRYGLRDTAMAVREAARAGVHVHCVSMDRHDAAHEYLRPIFGRRYLVLENTDLLPERLSEVFRDLLR